MMGKQGSPFGSAVNRTSTRGIVSQFLGKINICCDEEIVICLDMPWGTYRDWMHGLSVWHVLSWVGCVGQSIKRRLGRNQRKDAPERVHFFSFWNSPTQCRSAAASPLTTAVGGSGIAGLVGLNISLTTLMHLESAMVDELPRLNS